MAAVQATVGTDLTLLGKQIQTPELKWQLDAPVGGLADVRVTSGGFTLRCGPRLLRRYGILGKMPVWMTRRART